MGTLPETTAVHGMEEGGRERVSAGVGMFEGARSTQTERN